MLGAIRFLDPREAAAARARREQRRSRPAVWNPYLAHWWRDHELALAEDPSQWPTPITPLGPDLSNFPSGLASAPVQFVDIRTRAKTELRFVAGLVGVAQDPTTLALSPDVAWAVVHADAGARPPP